MLATVWFREFEQENSTGEIVDICEAEGDEGGGELVGDDLDIEGGEALFHVGCVVGCAVAAEVW